MRNSLTMFGRRALVALAATLALSAAAQAAETHGAFEATGQAVAAAPVEEYRIVPLDKLDIRVFQAPELTLEKAQVDAGGQLLLPLIGPVTAKGKTARELSREIADRLGAKWMQDPQVSVLVAEAVGRKVTVEGAVVRAGVFDIQGRTTLLQAVALAQGPARNADLKSVAVFRDVAGQRMAARYDLRSIRSGKAPDPEVLANDTVVVGGDAAKGLWREVISSLPALGIFAAF